MGLTGNLSKRTGVGGGVAGGEGWGMGFFLVFFPQEHHHQQQDFSSASPFKSTTINALLKRTSSTHILAKAQSTISICAFLIFLSLLLFTLSTFEPNKPFIKSAHHYRRRLSQSHPDFNTKPTLSSPALQRLGTLYSRGTKPKNDVVLCHVSESVSAMELKSFLRAFHRSGLLSKSDLVFIFHSITTPESFDDVIGEENQLFLKLVHRYRAELNNGRNVSDFPVSFDVTQLVKSAKETEKGEPFWGRKIKNSFHSNSSNGGGTELIRLSYGSVVGFGVGELDPENSLSGFLDHVPMSLRRWASYPMILGRLRRNFKHVMLVDVKEVLLLGDPLGRVRSRTPESVLLSSTPPPPPTRHNRKGSDKTHQKIINPAVILGGVRGMRRLSDAMLMEIVRAATSTSHSKKKTPITESALLSRLATNEFVQKNIRLVVSDDSIQEVSSLGGVSIANQTVIRRGDSNIDIDMINHICSFALEAWIYRRECERVQPL